jgi:hypothetical protein
MFLAAVDDVITASILSTTLSGTRTPSTAAGWQRRAPEHGGAVAEFGVHDALAEAQRALWRRRPVGAGGVQLGEPRLQQVQAVPDRSRVLVPAGA